MASPARPLGISSGLSAHGAAHSAAAIQPRGVRQEMRHRAASTPSIVAATQAIAICAASSAASSAVAGTLDGSTGRCHCSSDAASIRSRQSHAAARKPPATAMPPASCSRTNRTGARRPPRSGAVRRHASPAPIAASASTAMPASTSLQTRRHLRLAEQPDRGAGARRDGERPSPRSTSPRPRGVRVTRRRAADRHQQPVIDSGTRQHRHTGERASGTCGARRPLICASARRR